MKTEDYQNSAAAHFTLELAQITSDQEQCKRHIEHLEEDLSDLNSEIIRVLRNESEFGVAILRSAIEHTNDKLKKEKQHLREREGAVHNISEKREQFVAACRLADEMLDALYCGEPECQQTLLYGTLERIDVYATDQIKIKYRFDI